MRPRDAVWLVALALSASACAQVVAVRAPVLYPARVPARAYPELLIAGAVLPEGDLMDRLVAHLQDDGRTVKKVAVSELEPLREAGEISPLALTLLIEPSVYSDVRQDWQLVPVQFCDFYWGCFTDFQPLYTTTPALVGAVRLTVYEGPTARVLQSEEFEAVSFEPDTQGSRARLLDQLGTQLEHAVDVIKTTQRVELAKIDQVPAAARGIEAIQRGDWQGGRKLLEQASQQLGGKSRAVQARVWYDLGIARWFGAEGAELTQAAFEQARRALALAASLEPRYARAIPVLERARERHAVLEAQRSATAHNFALAKELNAASVVDPWSAEPKKVVPVQPVRIDPPDPN